MKEIVTPKMDIDFSRSKKKGANIEKAVEAVGSINMKHGKSPVNMKGLLKRHGKEEFKIDLD